jgi:ABC-type Fe3+-hydroxamate transport system substrate-binding protein
MMEVRDQMGYSIRLRNYPQRIISLVPSLTELLFDLGLDKEIVGVTDYCTLPDKQVVTKTKIGGPKKFNFHIIDDLEPDLIIGNKEENYEKGIVRLQEKYPVWMSDIHTIEDALQMIVSIGRLVNRDQHAERLIDEIQTGFSNLNFTPQWKVAYLVWKKPWMVAGGNTFIHAMLTLSGFINLFEKKNRYPSVALEELEEAEVILLSSEPYSFTSEDAGWFRKRYPKQIICLVNGAMFSWYGSRMKYVPAYFNRLMKALEKDHTVIII